MYVKLLFLFSGLAVLESAVAGATATAQYTGRSVCAACHAEQASRFAGSQHDLAMQPATEATVLGDFDNASVTYFGVTTSFFRKAGKFVVRAEGPDGKLQDYEVVYTFGVMPLQQYLVEFPGGRLQALSLAWDARSKEQGGQRWFHLHPDEKIAHDDELHWTKPSQNWNSMCAECHSTHLVKNYDPDARTFSTTWSEIDVSCEACHGPGRQHVDWASHKPGWEKVGDSKGLVISLDERRGVQWRFSPEAGTAARSKVRSGDREIGMCARCHSRRSPISSDYRHGEPLLDHYLPRLLDDGIYYADGQIEDEVYVYGSFLQSKMYHAGVTCSDCHEPHSLKPRASGNGVCLQCHKAEKYEQSSHHFHKPGTDGASCAECHMPPRTYMVVDPRHDHSMRIPRPDLSVSLGTPNACNNCHADRTPEWAAEQVRTWYGTTPTGFQKYARGLHAARHEMPGAGRMLAELIRDAETPDIARETALAGIGPYLDSTTADVLAPGLSDRNPAVRAATLRALEYAPLDLRVRLAFPLLDDPVRAVRIEAAWVLAPVPAGELTTAQQTSLEKGLREYAEAQQVMAERPEAQTNLGNLYAMQGKTDTAVSAYKTAIDLNPVFSPAYINLADLYRSLGMEDEAGRVLREAVRVIPESADIHYALGLFLIRQKHRDEAVEELRQAALLNPDDAHYVYVYAVALNSTGKPEQAIMVLQGALAAHPDNIEILNALVAFNRDMGNQSAASEYAGKLRAVSP